MSNQDELKELANLFKLKRTMEAMTSTIANEDRGQTREELRDHLDYLDELDAKINKLKAKYEN